MRVRPIPEHSVRQPRQLTGSLHTVPSRPSPPSNQRGGGYARRSQDRMAAPNMLNNMLPPLNMGLARMSSGPSSDRSHLAGPSPYAERARGAPQSHRSSGQVRPRQSLGDPRVGGSLREVTQREGSRPRGLQRLLSEPTIRDVGFSEGSETMPARVTRAAIAVRNSPRACFNNSSLTPRDTGRLPF